MSGRQVLRGTDAGNLHAGGFQYERAQKNQRRYDTIADRNRTAAASFLTQRFDQHPAHVALLGPREVVAAFERALPQRVRERVILRTPQPPEADSPGARDAIVAKALEAVQQEERRNEQLVVDDAIGHAKGGGLAVLGPEDVVLAVNQRRVHRLILEDDFDRTGWMCRNCGALGINHVQRCSYCDGELSWVEALGEEIAGRVIADDGDVEIVPHTNKLHSYRGIAAMLRQAGARGLGISASHAPRS
jgi:peptide subunit release factor 1 (eRF1)